VECTFWKEGGARRLKKTLKPGDLKTVDGGGGKGMGNSLLQKSEGGGGLGKRDRRKDNALIISGCVQGGSGRDFFKIHN